MWAALVSPIPQENQKSTRVSIVRGRRKLKEIINKLMGLHQFIKGADYIFNCCVDDEWVRPTARFTSRK